MNTQHSPENSGIPQQTEQQKMMAHDAASLLLHRTLAHDAASLLLHRTLNKLVTGLEKRALRVSRAATRDFNNFGSTAEVAPSALREVVGVAELLDEVNSELTQVQEYWNALPWSSDIPYEDPRVAITPEEEQEVMRAVEEQVAFQQGCTCGQCHPEQRAEKILAGAILGGSMGGLAAGLAGAGLGTPSPQGSHVSPPGPDFDPKLLADKRVAVVDAKQDVRTRTTIGRRDVEHVVGGPPVFWLKAADGTRVAIPQEDLPKVIDALTQFVGNGSKG